LSDSGLLGGTRDFVADFEPGTDGQLHAFWSAIGQIVEGDVSGDSKEIKDPTHAISLANTDFNL
jgi:hypothetical protein